MMRIAGPVKGSAGQRPHGTKGTGSFLFHGLCSTGEYWTRGREGETVIQNHNKCLDKDCFDTECFDTECLATECFDTECLDTDLE